MDELRLRRRQRLAADFGAAQRRAVAAEFSVTLDPESLPSGFGDEVRQG